MHRYGLLATAVATVAVPGLLAVVALRGQQDAAVAGPAGVAAATMGAAALTGPFPVAPATARAPVRNDVAAMQRAAGTPVTVLSRVTAAQQALGASLLAEAANAGVARSYQGTATISEAGLDGRIRVACQLWHRGGGLTLIQAASAAGGQGAPAAAPSVLDASSPGGMFGVTRTLVALLGRHYVPVYSGRGSVARRPAAVVVLYRFDGSLAARYWLDRQTMVPLRRELFDTADRVIDEDSFVTMRFGPPAGGALAGVSGRPVQAAERPGSGWAPAARPAAFVAALTAKGWRLPGSRSGGLPLYAASSASTANGEVVDLQYSDGLYVISLFAQRGILAKDMPGWRPMRLGGQLAWVSGRSVTWTGRGFVYTMIADAPLQTVTQVVGGLPRSAAPGFLGRLGRGLARIVRVIAPFA